jgi:hypothetical protein
MQIENPTLRIARVLRLPRAASTARGAGAAVTALACAALLGACGGSSSSSESTTPKANVDTAKVARAIEGTVLEKRHLKSTVTCPAPIPSVPGSTFECIAKITGAKHKISTSPFLVTIQNNRGYVTYVGK